MLPRDLLQISQVVLGGDFQALLHLSGKAPETAHQTPYSNLCVGASLGFQRPLKEWSRSLDCFLPKDRFLRLALNIQEITVFVAQELLRVRSLTVTPPSSSQLQ